MEFLKIFWLAIPIGVLLFFTYGDPRDRNTVLIYFFTFVLVLGAAGFLYSLITTGHIPAPCCD